MLTIYKRISKTAFANDKDPAEVLYVAKGRSFDPVEVLAAIIGYTGEVLEGKDEHIVHEQLKVFHPELLKKLTDPSTGTYDLLEECLTIDFLGDPLPAGGNDFIYCTYGIAPAFMVRNINDEDWYGAAIEGAADPLGVYMQFKLRFDGSLPDRKTLESHLVDNVSCSSHMALTSPYFDPDMVLPLLDPIFGENSWVDAEQGMLHHHCLNTLHKFYNEVVSLIASEKVQVMVNASDYQGEAEDEFVEEDESEGEVLAGADIDISTLTNGWGFNPGSS